MIHLRNITPPMFPLHFMAFDALTSAVVPDERKRVRALDHRDSLRRARLSIGMTMMNFMKCA
jgi:hypothetical protein